MQAHLLRRETKNRGKKRIGRGGKRGTYSGRGIKGQKARSGHKIRPEIRDVIKKIPKKRGEHGGKLHSIATKPAIINLSVLAKLPVGTVVTPEKLAELKFVRIVGKDPARSVKILGDGELTKAITVRGCIVSGSARAKIEKAGGTVTEKNAGTEKPGKKEKAEKSASAKK